MSKKIITTKVKERVYKFLYIFSLSSLFLALTCLNIDKPPPCWEESILSYPAIAMTAGYPVPPWFKSIQIFGKDWAIMLTPWVGAIESYLMLPIFKIFGIGVYTLRSTEILLALLIGLLFGYLCYLMFNERVWFIALPLILFNTIYLLYGRAGGQASILILWGSCALCLVFFWKWIISQKTFWLYLSAFVMGAGMYGKLHFLWISLGIVFGWMFLLRSQRRLKLSGTNIIKAFLAWCLGFSPYIIQNIRTQGSEIYALLRLFLNPPGGSRNLDYFRNLFIRFAHLGNALGGMKFCTGFLLWLGWVKMVLIISLFVLILLPGVRERLGAKKNPLFFLLICILTFMLGIAFKGAGLGREHVFVILPLMLICSAAVLNTLIRNRVYLILVVFLMLVPDLFIIANYHMSLRGRYGDPMGGFIVELSDYLLSQGFRAPILVNHYSFAPTIAVLTKGKVFPIEAHPDVPLIERYAEWLNDSGNVYILYKGFFSYAKFEEEGKMGYAIFKKAVQKNKKRIHVLKVFSSDPDTLFSVCRVE